MKSAWEVIYIYLIWQIGERREKLIQYNFHQCDSYLLIMMPFNWVMLSDSHTHTHSWNKKKNKNDLNCINKMVRNIHNEMRYIKHKNPINCWTEREEERAREYRMCSQQSLFVSNFVWHGWRLLPKFQIHIKQCFIFQAKTSSEKKNLYFNSDMKLMIYRDEFIMCFTNLVNVFLLLKFYVGSFDQYLLLLCPSFSTESQLDFFFFFHFRFWSDSFICYHIDA